MTATRSNRSTAHSRTAAAQRAHQQSRPRRRRRPVTDALRAARPAPGGERPDPWPRDPPGPAAPGPHLTAFISISMDRHTPDRFEAFEEAVRDYPEVIECAVVTGQNSDYLLQVVVPDMVLRALPARKADAHSRRHRRALEFCAAAGDQAHGAAAQQSPSGLARGAGEGPGGKLPAAQAWYSWASKSSGRPLLARNRSTYSAQRRRGRRLVAPPAPP
jgi:hypothetical protein